MTSKTNAPHGKAHCRDGSSWLVPLSRIDSLRAALMAGRAFWSGVGVWGEQLTIKLADIVAVALWTADATACASEDEDDEKDRALLGGGL